MAKSPTKTAKTKTPTSRKPSQTARILEHVEMLLALQEEGLNDRTDNTEFDWLISEFEAWKKESQELHEEARLQASRQITSDIEAGSKEIREQLDKLNEKVTDISGLAPVDSTPDDSQTHEITRLISEFESWKAESLELHQQAQEQASQQITSELESNTKEMLQSLESKLSKQLERLSGQLTDHASKLGDNSDGPSKNAKKQKGPKPQTNQVDNKIVELLKKQSDKLESSIELLVEQTDTFDSQVNERFNSLDKRFKSLDERFVKIADGIERQEKSLAKNNSQTSDKSKSGNKSDQVVSNELSKQLQELKSDLEEQFELATLQLEEKTTSFADLILEKLETSTSPAAALPADFTTELSSTLEEQLGKQIESKLEKHLDDKFEHLDDRISKITQAVSSQQTLIESNSKTLDFDEISEKLDVKTNAIVKAFETQIEGLFGSLAERVVMLAEGMEPVAPTETQNGDSTPKSKTVSRFAYQAPEQDTQQTQEASVWHERKKEMLSKYGIDPDYRPVMDLPDKGGADSTPVPVLKDVNKEKLEELHDSIDNMSADDAEKIEQLKQDLTSKLRDAEVELSINRAKLSQFKAKLEEKQVELDRQASAIEAKLAQSKQADEKKGILWRLTRHLRQQPDDKR
ncbi:MAG: hypothetical protein AB8B55_10615 [Mariniblastus sp.]